MKQLVYRFETSRRGDVFIAHLEIRQGGLVNAAKEYLQELGHTHEAYYRTRLEQVKAATDGGTIYFVEDRERAGFTIRWQANATPCEATGKPPDGTWYAPRIEDFDFNETSINLLNRIRTKVQAFSKISTQLRDLSDCGPLSLLLALGKGVMQAKYLGNVDQWILIPGSPPELTKAPVDAEKVTA